MDRFARLAPEHRRAAFEATAERVGISATAIVEKDFWVCWTLCQLFTLQPEGLLFKGGTSLSKCFDLIHRFSEDIDLTLDREVVGAANPAEAPEAERRGALNRLRKRCKKFARRELLPRLQERFAALNLEGGFAQADESNLRLDYPRALLPDDYGQVDYLEPAVLLEIGARGDMEPHTKRSVTSFVARHFPDAFDRPTAEVRALSPERTFWEKAVLLHNVNVREAGAPDRLSRHAYDLHMLSKAGIAHTSIADGALLEAVVANSRVFWGGEGCELAKPGTFRLALGDGLREALEADYRAMQQMLFEDPPPPTFEEIAATLAMLDRRINGGDF